MRKVLKAICLFVFLPGMAFAQYPDAVQVLIDDGLEVEARFNAPGGVEGYVGRRNGHPVSLYLMPDGEHVVIGKMMDGFGQNLSAAHIRAWIESFDKMSELNPEIVIPGHGEPTTLDVVARETRGYLVFLRSAVIEILESGGGLDEAYNIDQSQWAYLDTFEELAGKNAGRVYQHLEFDYF